MSSAYFSSEWGKLEHLTLLFRDPTNVQRRFIPLLMEDCKLPDIIAQFARIDWQTPSDKAYASLLAACWEVETEKQPAPRKLADQARMVLRGHVAAVWGVAITPDGKTVVSGSKDNNVMVWDLATGRCRTTLIGHNASVWGVAISPNGEMAVSSSYDKTLKVWNLATGQCHGTFTGHTDAVLCVAVTPDGKNIVSGSKDRTLKVWDIETGHCITTLIGHNNDVLRVAITPDGKTLVSTSIDKTLRVWDLETGKCSATFKGLGERAWSAAITPDGKKVVSSSSEKTLRVWDLATGYCLATFEGHTGLVWSVAITPDGTKVVSSSNDKSLKVWDLATGHCITTFFGHIDRVREVAITPDGKSAVSGSHDGTLRVWDLPSPDKIVADVDSMRYTNAKVVLVGETGVGKTGLALRLCEDRWEPTESTHGMIISRLELPKISDEDMEREVWLWDFAGQTDYRLIHQLFMDETALGVLVFNPQDDNPFDEMGRWEKALHAATKFEPARLLVAARCDRGGISISKKRFEEYIHEHGFAGFLCTGAKTGEGCEELKEAIAREISWDRLPWIATTQLFKTLKDAILELTEGKTPLVRLPELCQRLQLLLPKENIAEDDLRAVVGLMQSQGVVQMLSFGDFLLLQPAWLNRYA
jgi:GTPase SAR1 family protein/myo-inositol-hexaphosphate 3-phosphohydrolase